MMRGLNHYPDAAKALNADIFFTLTNHALIIVCKFLEVWHDSNALAKTDSRIIQVRRAVSPFIDRIGVWKGLREQRNSALAHAYLDKDRNLVTPWQGIEEGTAPSFHAEIVLLLQLVYLCVLAILSVFEVEYAPIDILAGPRPVFVPSPGPGIELGSEIQDALRPIAADVEARLRDELQIVVRGPLLSVFISATTPRTA